MLKENIIGQMMNGFNNDNFVHDFCGTPLLNMDQKDDIAKINALNDYVFLKHDRVEQWKNILCRYTDQNLHIMNKRALDRKFPDIIDMFKAGENV